jgi:glycosyltransferase involved in cell wall biosynthesis
LQARENSLLLVTHVAVRRGAFGLQIDDQTAAGIAQWCRYFDRVTYFGILQDSEDNSSSSTVWVDLADVDGADRCELRALPRGYRLGQMLRQSHRVHKLLKNAVATHAHLCFTIGGLVGDWPAIAAFEARAQRRKYAAWIDRVEPSIIRNRLQGGPVLKRAAAAIMLPIMEKYTIRILSRSTVALLQGRDTFDHYASWAPNPHCTYDTHTHVRDEISGDALARKQACIESGEPLKIIYVGRAAPMKGPLDWIAVMDKLHHMKVPFRATWIGDGAALGQMRARIDELGLMHVIDLAGFEGDRDKLLGAMRGSDLLVFCHKTPESPRCLVEALVSGCALAGYESAYPKGLVEDRGGAVFATQDDIVSLAGHIGNLHRDRGALAGLVSNAAASGRLYNEDAVYAHRAKLMQLA